ncbi:MFS transporter [Thermoanaerobacterium thermosaccharolyticum]|uniref:MFS transporter n=1 Tax=Thermoanaerobacterium thermosaccharolyticum TaxID=1517 RepID=UPI00177E3010|nr:MFS transporter [Thermoanaerobacterium thermosaccharolyticum]MBE0068752.1 MFS transporter [Thermoanaerobacterium thermosaccharolyticum]MBE0228681.1 MFS transporter [Thermoanaerobacterium thermosaccharolyticum]
MQIFIVVLNYLLMLLIGLIDNIKGPVIAPIKSFYHIDYTYIGLLLFIGSLGFITASFIGGIIVNRYGSKAALSGGLIFIILGILGYFVSPFFFVFAVFFFIMNFGLGMLEIGINATAAVTFVVNQALMMNLLHFFYGAGATISPNAAGRLVSLKYSWQNIYLFGGILAFLILIVVLFTRFPGTAKYVGSGKVKYLDVLKDRHVILFSVMLGFYIASEVGIGNWAVTYLKGSYGMNSVKSSMYLSLFFAAFTIGRLLGGFVVEKIGYVKSIFIFASLAASFVALSMVNQNLSILLSIAGLFYSIIYPTTMALAMKSFKENTGVVISVIVTVSSSINMVANFIIGKLSDLFGVFIGFSFIVVFMVLVIVMLKVLSSSLKSYSQ